MISKGKKTATELGREDALIPDRRFVRLGMSVRTHVVRQRIQSFLYRCLRRPRRMPDDGVCKAPAETEKRR